MTNAERQNLYDSWVRSISENAYMVLKAELRKHKVNKNETDTIRGEVDVRVLSHANVIGITTTGLARNIKHLRKLTSKVLVVEEAGEVLEAHPLTVMLPSLEHAILIGDHQQLRPKVQNYDLSVENPRSAISLDVSLFERIISSANGLPFVTLETQRRMHPSVSELIRSTLYPKLQDANSVKNYPEVTGMRQRLFWMDHERPEDGEADQVHSTSHTNSYEVDMVAALVHHLVRQGVYSHEDIAVLTPYLGQRRKLRRKFDGFFSVILNDRDIDELERDGEDGEDSEKGRDEDQRRPSEVAKGTLSQALRLATVDNFQGEEAKVVIISLVRSNEQRKCGFLRTSNRINVLLSRAMHGMYMIGNSKTSEHVDMWGQVLEIFRANGNIGPALDLCCPRHPETPLLITEPEHFAHVAPEAGGSPLCGKMLPCGHRCPSQCHADSLHNATFCEKDCNRRPKTGCDHPCPNRCRDRCPDLCHTIVQDIAIQLACGHRVTSLPCWQYQDKNLVTCMEPVQRTIPGCQHEVVLPCCQSFEGPEFKCWKTCASVLDCGHHCTHKCNDCRPRLNGQPATDEAKHGPCKSRCGRDYNSCNHSCRRLCHGQEPCDPCSARCGSNCIHSSCAKACSDPCTPCAEETCSSRCPHPACNMPCSAPCDWIPCSKRCERVLSCGHQCPSICGEECPGVELCQVCASDEVKDTVVDLVMLQTYGDIDLDSEPCIVLPCRHIFTVESMDGSMDMATHYEIDAATGDPTGLKGEMLPLSYEKPKTCPTCRGSLRSISRYGRIVRRSLLDESTKKFITWSNRTYVPLAERLQQEQAKLSGSLGKATLLQGAIRLGGKSSFHRDLKGMRYKSILKLGRDVYTFSQKVAKDEQPFQRAGSRRSCPPPPAN